MVRPNLAQFGSHLHGPVNSWATKVVGVFVIPFGDAPGQVAGRQAGLDADGKGAVAGGKGARLPIGGEMLLDGDGRLPGSMDGRMFIGDDGEYGRERVPAEMRDETAPGIDRFNQRLENLGQCFAKNFSAVMLVLQKGGRERGEAGYVYIQDNSRQTAMPFTVCKLF